jgi:hypothetical protein
LVAKIVEVLDKKYIDVVDVEYTRVDYPPVEELKKSNRRG